MPEVLPTPKRVERDDGDVALDGRRWEAKGFSYAGQTERLPLFTEVLAELRRKGREP